jgi:hypothetical protein
MSPAPSTLLQAASAQAGNGLPPAWVLALALLAVLTLLVAAYRVLEKRRRREILSRFRKFNESRPAPASEMRVGERLVVPEALQAEVTLTDGAWFGLKGRIVNVSTGGFGVKPDFPLKKVPLGTRLDNVLVNTPGTRFVVRRARTVRIEHQVQKRLIGLQILAIDEEQNRELLGFMNQLQEFLLHDRSRAAD